MDKELIIKRFSRSFNTYSENAVIQRETASELLGMIGCGPFGKVLEIGCGDGLLTREFVSKCDFGLMTLNDICPSAELFLTDLLSDRVGFVAADAETMDFPVAEDLIVSASTVQWFEDLPFFFAKCAEALRERGMLAFSTFGPDNLAEVAALEGVSLHYYSAEELKEMLAVHFDVKMVSEKRVVLPLRSPADVLRHLKRTGVKGLKREMWTKGHLSGFSKRYKECFSLPDGGVSLTYHPICVVAVKRPQVAAEIHGGQDVTI